MIHPRAVITLTVTTPENVAWVYTLPPEAAELLTGLVSGEYRKITMLESGPRIARGRPMTFEIAVTGDGGSGA